jgi:hypothetical protein
MSDSKREAFEGLAISVVTAKLKFEIRNIIIVDKEILGEDVLELVYNFGDDTVNMREIEMEEKIRLK